MKAPFISRKSRQAQKSKKAFALVLSLALMGFMVLLVTTLSTMVSQQLRLSRQSLNDFKAKQAAKFAAFQALSRVQEALGPDQRITANAMMFEKNISPHFKSLDEDSKYEWWKAPMGINRDEVENISSDDAISENRHWVGVWDSRMRYQPAKMKQGQERESYIKNTVDEAVTWLVSGNKIRDLADKSGSHLAYKPTQKLDKGSYVRLVGPGSVTSAIGNERSNDVIVPLVTLGKDPNPITNEIREDGKETRIAWWVSDEGQKASLNAVAPQKYIEKFENTPYRIQSLPFYSGINALTMPTQNGAGMRAFDVSKREDVDGTANTAILRNLSSISQIDAIKSQDIPESTNLSKLFFHSVTFNTKGLLVNVRDGGLKKDLTLGLTRKDFGNEEEDPGDNMRANAPEYFERPYGTAGYEYKTSAYPLLWENMKGSSTDTRVQPSNEKSRRTKGLDHIFPPQMFVHDDLSAGEYESASTIGAMLDNLFEDTFVWKDPGGPLWSQLRSYYNLRAENDPDTSKIKDRIQTDDRIGFKPVVKRFQVFYVPTFVHYGNQRYGVRLHIIPMLVLYNPYDVKIAGESYYVLQLKSDDYHANPVGSFRFAVGYKSGANFQCLRDLRAERLPSLSIDALKTESIRKRLYLKLSKRGIWDAGTSGYEAPDDMTGTVWGPPQYTYHSSITYRSNQNANDDYTQPLPYWASTKTFFYQHRIVPLGYGTSNSNRNNTNCVSGEFSVSTPVSSPQFPSNYNARQHWKGIVASGNLIPSFTEAKANKEALGNGYWTARVAAIPLFLNNLYMSTYHGRYVNPNQGGNTDKNTFLFRAQRMLGAQNVNGISGNDSAGLNGDFHFVAYHKNGIEPGKAKIFAMEGIIAYVGDHKKNGAIGATKKEEIGPNGVVEEGNGDSPYQTKKALLRPLDEGGVPGGCFFMDVPHPEVEHYYKYASGSPWDYQSAKYANVLFDLSGGAHSVTNPVYKEKLKDINNNYPPADISQYYIDMQDVTGHRASSTRPLQAYANMTPIGYGMYHYLPNYQTTGQRQATSSGILRHFTRDLGSRDYHRQITLSVFLWKREGYRFHEIYNVSHGSGINPEAGPLLAQFRGYRVFLGNGMQSFPDPTLSYSSTSGKSTDQSRINFHQAGIVRNSGGRYASLMAPYSGSTSRGMYSEPDKPGFIPTKPQDEYKDGDNGSVVINEDADSNEWYRLRYYINWLPLNPRRHSANCWKFHGTAIKNGVDFMGDAAPEAVKGDGFVVDSSNFNYMAKLHAHCSSGGDKTTYVPYGIIFAQPYAENSPGTRPFFNRRLFVNSSILSTYYGMEYCGRDVPNGNQSITAESEGKFIYNSLGRVSYNVQAFSQIYSSDESLGDGMSNIGYTVNQPTEGFTYTGLRDTIGADEAPIHHILRRTEVVSNPANLSSANLSFGVGIFKATQWDGSTTDRDTWYRSYHLGYPEGVLAPYAIGNSLCPSRIIPDRSYHVSWLDGADPRSDESVRGNDWNKKRLNGEREDGEDRHVFYDMSWHLNNALWDEYFFSTLPYRIDDRTDAEALDSTFAMPLNPRLQYVSQKEEDKISFAMLDSDETQDQFDRNAAKLWINGPFNVNSTSVDAWKAILSIHYGEEVEGYKGSPSSNQDSAPMLRWEAPFYAKPVSAGEQVDNPDIMNGYRTLSNDEIEQLACAIVEHIKDRGPFYSMSHFVNRVVSNYSAEERYKDSLAGQEGDPLIPPDENADRKNLKKELNDEGGTHRVSHMQKGVLQAAIDSTEINSTFHDDDLAISIDADNNMTELLKNSKGYTEFRDPRKLWENWRGAIGPQATGAPTYLMQQDILARIGSFLTVRSDTFKIRAYGEVKNSITGNIESKAWCEMVIQRMPEYVSKDSPISSNGQQPWDTYGRELEIGHQEEDNIPQSGKRDNLNTITDELSEINKTLGRKFKIVSFRWLNDSEI